jgi:uncharacterized protein YndB with AHSA1/START domain
MVKKVEAHADPDDYVLVVSRIFDAPRELVFAMWTDINHLKNWMGPDDYPAVRAEGDLRPGGAWRVCLRSKNGGRNLWQRGVYREILEPERLAYTFLWDQEDGAPGHEMLVTITFEDNGGKTLVTLRQAVFETIENRDGHRWGWNGTFDRLSEYLSTS